MSHAVTARSSGSVLIVEDDTGIATLQRRRLERAGYTVTAVATAEAAVTHVMQGGVDLVVLDYSLPGGITGLDFYRQLKAAGHDLPVIMVTGQSNEAIVIQALRDGVHDFVTKSTAYLDYLPDAVARVLARVSSDRRLEASEQRFRAIVETTSEWIWEIDATGRHTYSNPAVEAILGYRPEDLLGRDALELMHDEDRRQVEAVLLGLMAAKQGWAGLVLRWRHQDGTYRWLESNGRPILDAEGDLVGYRGADRDVTERLRAEETLRESESRFRQLTEHIRHAFWITDVEQRTMLYISPAYEAIWGRSCESLYAHPQDFLEAIHPDDRERVRANQTKKRTGEYSEEYRVVRPDGSVRWVWSRSFPVADEQGRIYRIVGLSEDITVRKQAEAALRASEARQRALLAATPDLMFRLGRDGEYRDVHANDQSTLYLPPESLIGKKLSDVLPPEAAGEILHYIARTLDTGALQVYEYQLPTLGGVHDFEGRIVPSGPDEVLFIARDITDRKRFEEELKQATAAAEAANRASRSSWPT